MNSQSNTQATVQSTAPISAQPVSGQGYRGKVIVGMSGGVDSSVAAYLLLQQGYDVEGLFMKNWEEDDGTEYCTAQQDLADAEQVCQRLGIKLHTANFAAEYWDNVFSYFLEEYQAYRTPNPDILCNKEIKFKVFLEYAEQLGAQLIATGHYAQVKQQGDHYQLHKAVDNEKDQSYFLHAVAGKVWSKTLFPLGSLQKPEVRAIAEQQNFENHNKKDSTGICFIGERRFKDFLKTYLPAQPGPMININGDKLGIHDGLMFYTYGQRKGLGIGGVKGTDDSPWYVVEKDVANNRLIVAQGEDHEALLHSQLWLDEIHWINEPKTLPLSCQAKIRYRQADQQCQLFADDGAYKVIFDQPQRAVTPGQFLVLYQQDHCLGGGIVIRRS